MTAATVIAPAEPRAAFDRISLRRLVLIRWVAVAGQAMTLLLVHSVFGFRLPLARGAGGGRLLGAAQSVLRPARRAAARLGEREAAFYLGYERCSWRCCCTSPADCESVLDPDRRAGDGRRRRCVARPVMALSVLAVGGDQRARAVARAAAVAYDPLTFPPELIFGIWVALVIATVFIAGYT